MTQNEGKVYQWNYRVLRVLRVLQACFSILQRNPWSFTYCRKVEGNTVRYIWVVTEYDGTERGTMITEKDSELDEREPRSKQLLDQALLFIHHHLGFARHSQSEKTTTGTSNATRAYKLSDWCGVWGVVFVRVSMPSYPLNSQVQFAPSAAWIPRAA